MTKRNSKATKSTKTVTTVEPVVEVVTAVEAVQAPVETVEDKAARVARQVNRLPFAEARAFNGAIAPVDPTAPASAGIALTAKGTNLSKRRVYGYDNSTNGNGGGIPKSATVVVVPGFMGTPKAVNPTMWAKLLELVQANPQYTVEQLYQYQVDGRCLRRAYRAGAIRFAKQS